MIPKGALPEFAFRTQRNRHRGLPWFGDDCSSAWSPNRQFNPCFKVYGLPLKDMSRPDPIKYDDFSEYIDMFRNEYHVGDSVNAIEIDKNSAGMNAGENIERDAISGKILKMHIDYDNKRLRVFLIKDGTSESFEVYPSTIFSDSYMYECVKKQYFNHINESKIVNKLNK